jgi:hypothetical protein
MSGLKRYQVTLDVAAENLVDACDQARELVKPGVGLTVREYPAVGPPSARGILATGVMRWSVTVNATIDSQPCELMLTFDPARRRAIVLLLTIGDGDSTTVGTPLHLQPRALQQLIQGIALWPEDVIARMVTEDIMFGGGR